MMKYLRAVSFLFPVFLFLLPLAIFSSGMESAARLKNADIRRQWAEEKGILARQLEDMAQPGFWVGEAIRGTRVALERRKSWEIAGLTRFFGDELPRFIPKGMRRPKVYAFLHGEDGAGNGVLLTGKGFEAKCRAMLSKALRNLGLQACDLPNEFQQNVLTPQVVSLFGGRLPRGILEASFHGRSFPVLFEKKFYLAAWENVIVGGKPRVSFLFLFPNTVHSYRDALVLTLKNHRRYFRAARVTPVFIPIRTPMDRARTPILASVSSLSLPARSLCRQISSRIEFSPPQHGRLVGSIGMPCSDMYKVLEASTLWGYACALHPLSGYIGMFVGKRPASIASESGVPGWLFAMALAGWGLYCFFRKTCGSRFPGSVRTTLLLWILGLSLLPLALIWGTGQRMFADLESNRLETLKDDLNSYLEDIETGFAETRNSWLQACRTIIASPLLNRDIDSTQLETASNQAVLDRVWESLEMHIGEPRVLAVLNSANQVVYRKAASISEEDIRVIISTLKISGAAKVEDTPAGLAVQKAFSEFDSINEVNLARKKVLRYYNRFTPQSGKPCFLIAVWEEEAHYSPYLVRKVASLHERLPDVLLGALRMEEKPVVVARAGDPRTLESISIELNKLRYGIKTSAGEERRAFLFSRSLPGHLFVAAASTRPILDGIAAEKRRSVVILALLLLLAVIGSGILSGRLAYPIVKMTQGLERISNDDLSVRVSEYRHDEIGEAGKTLDMMTRWLAERQKLSRFVSPQVLEVVGKGDPEQLSQATRREAVTLVSDIRSFTTLSETHPPELIFSLINRHLQIMTRVIQKHGGVIDRFIGDAIQAVYYSSPGFTAAEQAVEAALEMMDEHRAFNAERKFQGLFTYGIGIGIDQGSLLTGVMGDPAVRLDFSVVGDPMKHAADLEASSKCGKATKIVCSGAVRDTVSERFGFMPVEGADCDDAWEVTERLSGGVGQGKKSDAPALQPEAVKRQASRSASETAGGPAFQASSGAILLFGLLAILIPFGLTVRGLDTISGQARVTRLARMQAEFREEFNLAEKSLEPRFQISLDLRFRAEQALDQDPPGETRLLASAVSSFAGARCFRLDVPKFGQPHGAFPKLFREVRIQPDGVLTPLSDRLLKSWLLLIAKTAFSIVRTSPFLSSAMFLNSWNMFEQAGGTRHDLERHFGQGFGNLFPVSLSGSSFQFLWVLGQSWNDPAVATLSAAFFLIPDDQITTAQGNRAFVANMARRGLHAAILPSHGPRNPEWIDPAFFRNPASRTLLDKPPLNLVEMPLENERLVAHARRSLGDRSRTLVLMQACPPDSSVPDLLRWGTMLFFGPFLLAWLLFLINERVWKRPVRVGLKTQMTGAFLVMILPIVLQGMLFLERSFSEQTFRFRADRIRETEAVARNMDRTLPVYFGGFLNLIQSRLDDPATRDLLVKAAEGEKTGVIDSVNLLARRIYKDLALAGVVLKDPTIGGAGFFGSNFTWDAKKGTLLQRKVLFDGPASVLQRFQTGGEKAGAKSSFEDMIVSVSNDQFRSAMSSVVSTEFLAEEYLGLRFFTQVSFSKDMKNSTMIRLFLFDRGVPRFCFLALLPYQAVLLQPLTSWNRSRSPLLPGDLPGVSVVHRSLPAIIPSSPFWVVEQATQEGYLAFATCFRFPSALFSEPPMQAFQTQSALSRFVTHGQDTILMSVLPRTEGDQTAFVAFSPFSRELAAELEGIARGRLLLLLLVVLCIGASWYASESFLRPVLDLSAAARQIRSGNFKVRLSEAFEGEFGLLAGSFNQMARGVEEGRLLSRFVSESVRMTAKAGADVDGSDRGKVVRVSVVFAGLSGFKTLMAEVAPEDLVVRLNTYLEAMSGIIRAHDGEIDKFIGDKILAVFHEDEPGSADSARKAVSAALAMRTAMAALESRIGSSIGIGVVTGNVLSGILGTAEVRLEHTVLGDTVNLASRLGDLAQKLDPSGNIGTTPGGGIVIEAETRRQLGEFPAAIHPLKLPPIKGKTRSVETYLVI